MTESDNFTHLKALPDGSLTQAEVGILVDEIGRQQRVIIDQQQRLAKQGLGIQKTQAALTRRNGLVKVLIGNLAQSGDTWADVLHRCGFSMSSEGYKTAMEIAKKAEDVTV